MQTFVSASQPSPWSALAGRIAALLADDRGLSTIEYSTLGGTLSGVILLAGGALQDATMVAVGRMTNPQ